MWYQHMQGIETIFYIAPPLLFGVDVTNSTVLLRVKIKSFSNLENRHRRVASPRVVSLVNTFSFSYDYERLFIDFIRVSNTVIFYYVRTL